MKNILILISIAICFGFTNAEDCGDETVYANVEQTQYDKRFESFTKIDGIPKFNGGNKKLDQIVRENLELSDVAKTQFFRLNYQFTVTREGKIKDVKQIGDSKADDWTNIGDVIKSTEGDWTPAEKDGNPVDCIYFRKISINGASY
jgi:hypothetical protein